MTKLTEDIIPVWYRNSKSKKAVKTGRIHAKASN